MPERSWILPKACELPEPAVYRVTIPGNPGAAKVNTRTTPYVDPSGRASVKLSKVYRQWRALAVPLMKRARVEQLRQPNWRECSYGLGCIVVTITAYWPTMNRTGPANGTPRGDVDAVAKACLDALGKDKHRMPGAGVIGDDAQVVELVCRKAYDKRNPRIEIEVRQAHV